VLNGYIWKKLNLDNKKGVKRIIIARTSNDIGPALDLV
jgi:hypothetical protein